LDFIFLSPLVTTCLHFVTTLSWTFLGVIPGDSTLTPVWLQKIMEETWTYQKFRKALRENKIVRKHKSIKTRSKFIVSIHTTMYYNISARLPHLRPQTA
jgi:hypothetical protein